MVQCTLENFKKISKSFFDNDPKKVKQILVHPDGSVPGFYSKLVNLVKICNKQSLLGGTSEEQALVRQWLDYAVATVNHVDAPDVSKQVLKDINTALANHTFVAGNFCSLADIVLYHLLYNTISKLTLQEKEQFMHLSRWYNNIQQNGRVRGNNPLLPFSRILLY